MSAYVLVYAWYALIGVISIAFGWLRSRMLYWRRRNIPHIEPSFVVGNLGGVTKTRHFSDALQEVYDKFKHNDGPFCGFYFLVNPVALVTDLNLTRNILIRDFNNFDERGMFYNERDDPLTAHLFSVDATAWRKLRSKFSPAFTSGKMKNMFPVVKQVGAELSRLCAAEQNSNQELEMHEILARYTTDVIGTCIFGLECNSLHDPDTEFRVINRQMFKKFRHSNIVRTLMHSFPKLARWLRMREMLNETHDFYFRIVRETIAQREALNIKRNDFMNMLIEMKNSSDEQKRANMVEITANAFLFFLAGFETSSTTMTFTLYELAQNQEIQSKLRAEISNVLEQHKGEFTYEAMQEMRYLDQVVAETLRKYAILPFLQRTARADYETDKPGYVIEKGTLTIIPIHAIHHDPDIYPEPEKFIPERFDADKVKKRHSVAWLPFGDGPRNCIGMRFGQMQMRVGLVSLLQHFKFTTSERTPSSMVFNEKIHLLSPKDGLYLHVEQL